MPRCCTVWPHCCERPHLNPGPHDLADHELPGPLSLNGDYGSIPGAGGSDEANRARCRTSRVSGFVGSRPVIEAICFRRYDNVLRWMPSAAAASTCEPPAVK